jgi:hypothetical protein
MGSKRRRRRRRRRSTAPGFELPGHFGYISRLRACVSLHLPSMGVGGGFRAVEFVFGRRWLGALARLGIAAAI